MNDDDEFGDLPDSAFMEVDLDSITAGAAATAAGTASSTISKETDGRLSSSKRFVLASEQEPTRPHPNDNKRRKVSAAVSISPSHNRNSINMMSGEDLQQTLSTYFAYSEFRGGQLSVIQSVINDRKDTAVFWATGSGKSLCYQIPALATKKITVVVSPLISLMQDQVHKLNGLQTGKDVAAFLGSGQTDLRQEQAAIQGEYLLIYVTPEKLCGGTGSFLQQLTTLHTTRREIGLIAIDEAHCVSEWGHDFRKEFRQIGQTLRSSYQYPEIQQIPIMALTATAVPRVQQDIIASLQLDQPHIERQSFDRPNLIISVHKKDRSSSSSALALAMESLLKTLLQQQQETSSSSCSTAPQQQQHHNHHQQSTIIYCPTKAQVEEIYGFLKRRLEQAARDGNNNKMGSPIQVECYHAGMSLEARNVAHTNFLTGKTTVIVCTVAFGMGIDKPDTRRVIHYGPPKNIEEYYQQIGRAGRDGLKSECTMYVTEADFDRYKSDFYLGGLQGSAKQAFIAGVGAIKVFALDTSTCRRKALLEFFHETPSFGERCGTCDTCKRHATYDDNDLERDFGAVARVVLEAAEALQEQGAGAIVDVISGKSVDSYRYKRGIAEVKVKESVLCRKNEVKKRVSQDTYREFLVPLVQRGWMKEATKTSQVNGYSRSWTTYSVTPKGRGALLDPSVPIVLPVPESVLQAERKEKARRERVLSQLKESGVQIEKLPQDEIETGDGDVIRAYSKWQGYLESMRRNGKEERVAQLEELRIAVEKWRSETAISQRMAPGSVLAEHTLLTLCYAAATLPSGLGMGETDLMAAGVRTRGISSLCQVLAEWLSKHQVAKNASEGAGCDGASANRGLMQLTPGQVINGPPWKHAVYKVVKKTGLASWESSLNRFVEGESPQTIAMTPANGRPIQVRTVCNHILQAIVQGRGVDLHRLATFLPPPTASEWEQLQAAEIAQSLDVVEDDRVKKSDLLRPIMGDVFIDTPYDQRDEAEKAKFHSWCERVDWYMTLRRIDYKPTFSAD